jgi:hypothetical protein
MPFSYGPSAALTGAVAGASLLAHDAGSGPVPCSGARRRDKVLDEVGAAILGDAVAENKQLYGFRLSPGPEKILYPHRDNGFSDLGFLCRNISLSIYISCIFYG